MLRTDGSRFEPDRRGFSGTLLNECHTGGDIRQQPEGVPAGQNLDRTRYLHLFLSYPAKNHVLDRDLPYRFHQVRLVLEIVPLSARTPHRVKFK